MGLGAWAGRRQRGVGRGVVQAEADGGQDGVVGQRWGRSEQSARETTTRGACDKQDGRAAERPMNGRTNKQLNEQTSQETVANTNRMTKAETNTAQHSENNTCVVY